MLRQGLLLAVLGLTRFVFLDAGHAPGVDPLARWLRRKPRLPPPAGSKAAARRAWWERQRAWQSALLEKWRVLALSLIVASLLMLDGAVLLARGSPWEQGLGVAWMAVGTALAFGLLTPWAALAGALLLPFGSWVTGDALWVAAALGSLAVAFTHGRRPGADQWLAEHGLIGGLRREVVVRPR
jgi:hypothetical protein